MSTSHSASSSSGYVFALAIVFIWAGFVLISRHAGLGVLNGHDVTALRLAGASVVVLPLWWWRWRVPLNDPRLWLLALLGGIAYAQMAYWSFHFAPAAHGAVLLSGVLPFFVALLSVLLLGQALREQQYVALVLIAVGVLSLARHSLNDLSTSWPGDMLMLAGSFCWALYTVLVRRFGYSPLQTTVGVSLLAALVYLPIYALLLPKGLARAPFYEVLTQLLYQGVLVAVIAMLLYMQALARLGPVRLGTVMATVPAVAGLGAVIILQEPFSLWLLGGVLFTGAGAVWGNRGQQS